MQLPPFQYLLDEYGPDVHRLLVASVGPTDADDCYQETWIAALRAYPRLRDAANLRGWVLTVAHRKAIDHLRRRARAAIPGGDAATLTERAVTGHMRGIHVESPWPAVRRLPDKQRMAVALRFALDLDFESVGAAMGISSAAARRNVHEGLKKLREEYDHE